MRAAQKERLERLEKPRKIYESLNEILNEKKHEKARKGWYWIKSLILRKLK